MSYFDLATIYEAATYGDDQPSIIYTNLGILRSIIEKGGTQRSDIEKFLLLTADMHADTPIVMTVNSIGILDIETDENGSAA